MIPGAKATGRLPRKRQAEEVKAVRSGHVVVQVRWDSQWEDPERAQPGNVWMTRVAFGVATVRVDSVTSI